MAWKRALSVRCPSSKHPKVSVPVCLMSSSSCCYIIWCDVYRHMHSSRCLHSLLHTLQGQYQVKPKLPFIPGSEVSGIVCQLGSGVKGFKPGDLVSVV
jgi:hypothetical protein